MARVLMDVTDKTKRTIVKMAKKLGVTIKDLILRNLGIKDE